MTTQSNRRAEEEIARFTEKYPDTDLDSVPESVWNRVKEGADLSEAYGAHRKKLREEEADAVKGLHLYGAKIVYPQQIMLLNVSVA